MRTQPEAQIREREDTYLRGISRDIFLLYISIVLVPSESPLVASAWPSGESTRVLIRGIVCSGR